MSDILHVKEMQYYEEELAKARINLLQTLRYCTWSVSAALIMYLSAHAFVK